MASKQLVEAVEAAEDRAAFFIETSGADGFSPVIEVTKSNGDIGVIFVDNEEWNKSGVRRQQIMFIGRQMREMADDIESVVLISEAWSKTIAKEATRPASLKDEPDKIEVLVIAGATREENLTVMVDIFRDEGGKITLTKDRRSFEGAESKLTDYFWKGYDGENDIHSGGFPE